MGIDYRAGVGGGAYRVRGVGALEGQLAVAGGEVMTLLEKRVKELEEKVKELEARPVLPVVLPMPYPVPTYPQPWYPQYPPWQPVWISQIGGPIGGYTSIT